MRSIRRRLVRFTRLGALAETERPETPEAPELDPADGAPSPEEALAARRRWAATRRAIAELPANQRAVLVLIRFEGLSYREAAAVLGVTEGAVESRLFRAMRRLEAQVNEVLQRWAAAVKELGVEVKGLWLADFDSGDGYYYCWQLGEDDIEHFHRYETGFAGRRPITLLD